MNITISLNLFLLAALMSWSCKSSLQVKTVSGEALPNEKGGEVVPVAAEFKSENNAAPLKNDKMPLGEFAVIGPGKPSQLKNPIITWSAAIGASSYTLKISTQEDCSQPVLSVEKIPATPEPLQSFHLTDLPDGKYFVCLSALVESGHEASAKPYFFEIDTTPPGKFTITGPSSPSQLQTPVVSWSLASDAASYKVSVSSQLDCLNPLQTYAKVDSSIQEQALTALPDGIYVVCVDSQDVHGNVTSAGPYQFVIDTTPPEVSLGPRRIAGNSFTIRPTVKDLGPLTYQWSVVSGPGVVTLGTPDQKDTLIDMTTEGDYVLRLKVTDQVGLSTQADVSLTWDRSRAFSVGRGVTCAIVKDGKLYCWGRNNKGDVGNGNALMQVSPVQIDLGTGRSAISVAVGGFHTCVVLDDASVKCWGKFEATGYGDSQDRSAPGPTSLDFGPGRTVVSITTGFDHSCAILDNGNVKCWGANSSGQLGYGDLSDRLTVPLGAIDLGSGRTAVAISLGEAFTCALLDDGTIKCWGDNYFGQLGQGDLVARSSPPATAISMPGGRTAKRISTTARHACAVLNDDAIVCWGWNNIGQLGDRSRTNRSSPVLVSGLTGTPKSVVAGAASCVLRTNGTISCWGGSSQVNGAGIRAFATSCSDGFSTSTTACTAAGGIWSAHIGDCSTGVSNSPGECAASGGTWAHCSDFTKVTSGSCSGTWDASKFAYCSKSDGTQTATQFCTSQGGAMVGDGYCKDPAYLTRAACLAAGKTWHNSRIPGPDLDLGPGRSALALGGGLGGWLCAMLDNLTLTCWGDNLVGNLGYGEAASSFSQTFKPVDLGTGELAKNIVVSTTHTCSLSTTGAVKCWGDNTNGRLGTGDYLSRATPPAIPVNLASTATQVAAGPSHSCALLSDGRIQCWGNNSSGRLGHGSLVAETTNPVSVKGINNAVHVAVGNDFTCVVLNNGLVHCWGNIAGGRFGAGSSKVATYCSDGLQTTSGACTTAGQTWDTNLYGDCSNGISTSSAACTAVANGTWASCSNGTSSTPALCTAAGKIWDTTKYNYCTSGLTSTAAGTFCVNNGGTFGNLGYCTDGSYSTRAACLNAGKTWNVSSVPGAPVDLGGVAATQVVAASASACALLQNGQVRCWGANNIFQIGVGDTDTTKIYATPGPALDFGGLTVKQLSASTTYFCAILSDDSSRCWGGSSINYQQLGYDAQMNNLAAPSGTPIDFGTTSGVRAFAPSSDGNGSCVVLLDNSVRCFGNLTIIFRVLEVREILGT